MNDSENLNGGVGEIAATAAPSAFLFVGTTACLAGLKLLGLRLIKGKGLGKRILNRFLFWDSDQSTAGIQLFLPGHGIVSIPEECMFTFPSFTASELARQALRDKECAWLGEKLSRLSDRETLNGAGGKPVLGFALGAAHLGATDRLLHKALVSSRSLDMIHEGGEDGVRTLMLAPTNLWIVAAGYGGMGSPNAILQAARCDEIARRQIGFDCRRHLVTLAPSVCAGATLNYATAMANFGGFLRQVCFALERPSEVVLPVPGAPIRLGPDTQLFHSATIFGASNRDVCAEGREDVAAMAARFLYLMTETPLCTRAAGDFRDNDNLFFERAQGSPRLFDRVGVSWHSTDPKGRARAASLIGMREVLSRLV